MEKIQNDMQKPAWRGQISLVMGTLVAGALVVLLMQAIAFQDPLPIDLQTSLALQRTHAFRLAHLLLWISGPGFMPWSMVIVLGCGLLLWRRLGRRTGIYFMIISGLQGLLNTVFKALIARPRPDISQVWVLQAAEGFSFPSGHVMFYTVSFGFLLFLLYHKMPPSWKRLAMTALLWVFLLLVGVSRVFLGAHWLSDVIAARLIGVVCLAWAIVFYRASPWFEALPDSGMET